MTDLAANVQVLGRSYNRYGYGEYSDLTQGSYEKTKSPLGVCVARKTSPLIINTEFTKAWNFDSTVPAVSSKALAVQCSYYAKSFDNVFLVLYSDFGYERIARAQPCENTLLTEYLSKSESIQTEIFEYLYKIYSLETEGKQRAASKVVFEYIEIQLEKSSMQSLNSFLDSIVLERLSEWSISGLVRFTSRVRKHLSKWEDVCSQAQGILLQRGLDPKKVLAGILE